VTRWFRQSLSVADPFVGRCLTSSALLRFHTPLIEPDVRICRIRLSEKTHTIAVAIACDAVRVNQTLGQFRGRFKRLHGFSGPVNLPVILRTT
jgi:hypothetical protein